MKTNSRIVEIGCWLGAPQSTPQPKIRTEWLLANSQFFQQQPKVQFYSVSSTSPSLMGLKAPGILNIINFVVLSGRRIRSECTGFVPVGFGSVFKGFPQLPWESWRPDGRVNLLLLTIPAGTALIPGFDLLSVFCWFLVSLSLTLSGLVARAACCLNTSLADCTRGDTCPEDLALLHVQASIFLGAWYLLTWTGDEWGWRVLCLTSHPTGNGWAARLHHTQLLSLSSKLGASCSGVFRSFRTLVTLLSSSLKAGNTEVSSRKSTPLRMMCWCLAFPRAGQKNESKQRLFSSRGHRRKRFWWFFVEQGFKGLSKVSVLTSMFSPSWQIVVPSSWLQFHNFGRYLHTGSCELHFSVMLCDWRETKETISLSLPFLCGFPFVPHSPMQENLFQNCYFFSSLLCRRVFVVHERQKTPKHLGIIWSCFLQQHCNEFAWLNISMWEIHKAKRA